MKSDCKIPLLLFLDCGTRLQAPLKASFDKFVAVCGTDMKLGCKGQVDTLKKTRCGYEL